jgi:hypothetical protein
MTLDDFYGFSQSLVEKDCPVRDIPLYFNQTIKIQENEIDYDRHYLLIFPEFIEAICRVIDKAVQKDIPLVSKLEIYKNSFQKFISSAQEFKYIKEKFQMPIKNPELNLYEFDMSSQFYTNVLFPAERDTREYRTVYRNATLQSFKDFTEINNTKLKKLKDNYLEVKDDNAPRLEIYEEDRTIDSGYNPLVSNQNLNVIKEHSEDF